MATRFPPRYPQVNVKLHSRNPYALVSAVRTSLRHEGVAKREIEIFTTQALENEEAPHMREVCAAWVNVDWPRT